jgi:hypothetical protein
VELKGKAKKTKPHETKLPEKGIVVDKSDKQPAYHGASTPKGGGNYSVMVVDGGSQEGLSTKGPNLIYNAEEKGSMEKDFQAKKAKPLDTTSSKKTIGGVRVDEQPATHSASISGNEVDCTLKVCDHSSKVEMSMKEATLECVLMGASIDVELEPNHFVDPYVVDDSSVSLDYCE